MAKRAAKPGAESAGGTRPVGRTRAGSAKSAPEKPAARTRAGSAKPAEHPVTPRRTRAEAPSDTEVQERVLVLRRFRELLKTQRDRFKQYLEVLEKQQTLIEGEWAASTGDELEAHVNLESRIVADIFSIQKVIDPLEKMLDTAYPSGKRPGRRARPKKDEAAGDLKTSLENLRGEAAALLERNRALLAEKMEKVQTEIKKIARNPYRKGRSVYGETPAPALIDIEG